MKRLSIILPCRNESEYIGECLNSLLANDFPQDEMEIVVVDGDSDDGTRDIVLDYCNKFNNIKMIDNPERIKPRALNIGIEATNSKVWMRVDAHAIYSKDYVRLCVEGLAKNHVDNIGGLRHTITKSNTPLGEALAIGVSHPFAVGNAYYRSGSQKIRHVDTVFGGCYNREVFARVGTFNEKLLRTQDREFNYRLTSLGGIILLDPKIECWYYARTDLIEYINWVMDGGFWVFYARRYMGSYMLSWRNYIPLIFVTSLILISLGSIFLPVLQPLFLFLALFYISIALFFSSREARKSNKLSLIIYVPLVFFLTHLFYGIGSFKALFKNLLRR